MLEPIRLPPHLGFDSSKFLNAAVREILVTHLHDSSKKHSVLLIACFLWPREGNDNPHRMDYQGCEHPLTILYTLRSLKSIRCYFSYDVACTVNVGIDLSSI